MANLCAMAIDLYHAKKNNLAYHAKPKRLSAMLKGQFECHAKRDNLSVMLKGTL